MFEADKDNARANLSKLIDKYVSNISDYESNEYLERQLQTDFLDDFLKILGWDVSNKANLPLSLREVLVEKGETEGRPDYTFRFEGEDKFFVEVKSPSRGTNKVEDIFQAKRYGWSTRRVNVSILTDFKTFKVYDTTIKPNIDQPNLGLLFESNIQQYLKKDFEKLWIFSQKKVQNGSIEELILKNPVLKRYRIPVDVDFLEQLTKWREDLAKNFYKNNPELDVRMLNDIVQKLLDRLIFIRLLEDRDIIRNRSLHNIAENWLVSQHRDIQIQLNMLFTQLNKDFNGEIFKFHPCETFYYDSKIVTNIILELYPPKCAYDFSVIGVELLGLIYEKYLGKTIRLTPKRVKVEEKPEVRKAGGVYYTPKWVVDYIVDNTVGELITGKNPAEIAELKILDPACGSGSFSISALSYLYDYYLDYYLTNPNEAQEGTLFPKIIRTENGPRLSIYTKSEILRNNIYGVDLDPQAVEITMMSLYIKVLEGERALPHNKEFLPSLSKNIRCGNSLIGFDYLSQETLFKDSERKKINPFEWRSNKTGFGEIMEKNGGFHVIIGNPPYIRIQTMREWASKEVDYITHKYKTAEHGNYDIYIVFVEKAIELLNKEGLIGFILPHKFFQAEYGKNLREIIANKKMLKEIVNFTEQQVFDDATTYTCLLFLSKINNKKFKYAEIRKLKNPESQLITIKNNTSLENDELIIGTISMDNVAEKPWEFKLGAESIFLERLKKIQTSLGDISKHIFVGTQTSANKVFVLENVKYVDSYVFGFSKALNKEVKIESAIVKSFLLGRDIRKYAYPVSNLVVLCPYEIKKEDFRLFSEKEISSRFPLAYKYLKDNKSELSNREKGRFKGQNWYAFGYPKSMTLFQLPKTIVPDYNNAPSFTYDKNGHFYKTGYGIILKEEFSYEYILGLLNSKLLFKYLTLTSTKLRGGYVRFWTKFIKNIPIVIPTTEKEKKIASSICDYVTKILKLNKRKVSISNSSEIKLLDREIIFYEEEIDKMVFNLYRLNEDDFKNIF